MHKKTFVLSIRIQKIKDIKEQLPNKLIKLEVTHLVGPKPELENIIHSDSRLKKDCSCF